jgi:hypothetical protein
MGAERNLTDKDVEAIAIALKAAIVEDFKLDVGSAVVTWAKKITLGVLLALAVHGAGLDRAVLEQAVAR